MNERIEFGGWKETAIDLNALIASFRTETLERSVEATRFRRVIIFIQRIDIDTGSIRDQTAAVRRSAGRLHAWC